MTLLLNEEVHLKLQDLTTAIQLERQRRFINVQGRKKTFAAFISDTLAQLRRYQSEADSPLSPLLKRFEQYAYKDVAYRMDSIQALEAYIHHQQDQERLKLEQLRPVAPINVPKPQALLKQPVAYLKGVGPRLASQFAQLGIHSVENLLYYFPRRYLDYHEHQPIAQLLEGQDVSLIARVHSVGSFETKRRNLTILRITVVDKTGKASLSWFLGKKQQAMLHSMKARYAKGTELLISGRVKWDEFGHCPSFDRPEVEILSYAGEDANDSAESNTSTLNAGRIVPVYPLSQGVNLKALRRCVHIALSETKDQLSDPLPVGIKQEYHLLHLEDALQQIHFPDSLAQAEQARQRLVFDEFFYLQARLALLRNSYKSSGQGLQLPRKPKGYVDQLLQQLPFQLTGAQQHAFAEIQSDLASPDPMNRLLQGDVGSGKTVVAALTCLMAIDNGFQAALMAPTEILAEQHYKTLLNWLTPLGLKVGLVVGKAKAKQRREIQQNLLNGQIHMAVGTHALIQDSIEFANLGLIVVDEQHRFGVRQRMKLRDKGSFPELLTMTATPIPRSLAMTIHGDLDVSQLNELPPGRSPIITRCLKASQRAEANYLLEEQLTHGRQAYIVFPLVEESESLAAKAATTEAQRLQAEVFPHRRIGLLHGKLPAEEKERVMQAFAKHDLDILVATTVVEVGVDVPNATVILIENADRFGLAQLHQLRGRVGRGLHQSYCLLMPGSANSLEVQKRLSILEDSTDGFIIAEQDLQLRGPGDYLGTRQSGLPDFLLADLVQDQALLQHARQAAFSLFSDLNAVKTQHPSLLQTVLDKTEHTLNLMHAG